MYLDFKFISKEQYNCIENVLATLMNTWEKEYALMFSKNWGFTMLPSEMSKDDLIGYRIGGGEYNVWECLETYHDVCTKLFESEDMEKQMDVLDNELAEGNPVVLQIDGFYTPWKDIYNKYHFSHYCLVVNKDDLNDSYGCIDPYENSLINLLPKENLVIANAKCITVKCKKSTEPNRDWKSILTDAAGIILMQEGNISGVTGIRALATRIEQNFDVLKEIEGYEEMIWLAPIVFRISDIGSRRLNFSESLKNLRSHMGIEELGLFAERIEKVGWEWRRVRRTIVTAASDTDIDYAQLIAGMIRKIADNEEALANDILQFVNA